MAIPIPAPYVAAFEKLGFGMFVHWGLYSQLGKGEWIFDQAHMDKADYRRLFDTFTAADFDAPALARLAKQAGMRYIVLTTRHHEGFSLYDTRGLNTYDAPHSPAHRDLVREFVDACRAEDIVPFFYHTGLGSGGFLERLSPLSAISAGFGGNSLHPIRQDRRILV